MTHDEYLQALESLDRIHAVLARYQSPVTREAKYAQAKLQALLERCHMLADEIRRFEG